MLWQPLNLTEVCPARTDISACSSFGYVYLNLLVQLFGDSKDRRKQECLRHNDDYDEGIIGNIEKYGKEEYDFIVVGAGSAGCVVANRLTKNPKWKVLLLEAGPEQPDVTLVPGLTNVLIGSNIDWQYRTMPDGKSCLAFPEKRCDWPRGKTMGGSSSINSLAYIRGNKVDYDYWAEMGNVGWSYNDVLPYFKKSERNLNIESLDRKYHGIDGEQSISRSPYIDTPSVMLTDAFHEAGLPLRDYNGAKQLGTMQAQKFARDGQRVSTNNAFIQPIRYKRKNIKVRVNSETVKILIDEHKIAYGVKYLRKGKMHIATAKKEVIVSAGAINSPKLLMLSGIGPKKHLHDLGIKVTQDAPVGENLHDHVTFNGMVIALPNKTATSVSNEEVLQELYDYHNAGEIKKGPLTSNGPVSSVAFIKTDPNLPAPDIQYQVDEVILKEYLNSPIDYESANIFPTSFYTAAMPRTMLLTPESRGVLLLNSTNPHSHPLLYANYLGEPRDFIPLIKGVRFLLTLENTKAFKERGAYFVKKPMEACKDYEWGTDDYLVCLAKSYTSSPYHPVGTCKMGPKWDNKAVVDPRLRVYGVSGLRVIDASIMPVVVRGNTNGPSIMIGEKGVAMVIEDWLKNYKHKCQFCHSTKDGAIRR